MLSSLPAPRCVENKKTSPAQKGAGEKSTPSSFEACPSLPDCIVKTENEMETGARVLVVDREGDVIGGVVKVDAMEYCVMK